MSGFVKAGFSFLKNLGKGQKTTGTEVIDSVTPNVPVTKGDKIKRDLKIATQKSKASQAKLDNTIFRIEQQKKRLKDMQTKKRNEGSKKLFEASKGRKEFKFGSKRKSNVQKIKETFGPGSSNPKKSAAKKKKFPDLTGDGKVTFADILKGRGVKRG